jgi:hypothetical protein
MINRRSLFARAATVALAPALIAAAPCAHDWVSIGSTGQRSDHQHLVCRSCRLQQIEVHNAFVGDPTREGLWSVPEYARAFDYHPPAERVQRAIAAHL